MSQKRINLHKMLALVVLLVLYAILSASLLGIVVPRMLRSPDTVEVFLGFVAATSWFIVTGYLGALYTQRKNIKKQGKDS